MTVSSRMMPAEWYPQSGVLLTWPHRHSDWANMLDEIEAVYLEIVLHISRFEKVLVVAYDKPHLEHIIQSIAQTDAVQTNCRFVIYPTNDTWTRDYGPITIFDNEKLVLLDFEFNGWGKKFDASLDTKLTQTIYPKNIYGKNALECFDFILEGGSIESDGEGTLLTTSECLCSPMRNPAFSRQQIEELLLETLGGQRLLWLDNGYLAGDDTDSHIDTLARFTDAKTIVYVQCQHRDDEHYEALSAMEKELQFFTHMDGEPYRLFALPMPEAKYCPEDGHRLPATYANFLIINSAVLVPVYDDPNDQQALDVLQQCFPQHEIVGINCLPIIRQHGSLHCITMQLPEGILDHNESDT